MQMKFSFQINVLLKNISLTDIKRINSCFPILFLTNCSLIIIRKVVQKDISINYLFYKENLNFKLAAGNIHVIKADTNLNFRPNVLSKRVSWKILEFPEKPSLFRYSLQQMYLHSISMK